MLRQFQASTIVSLNVNISKQSDKFEVNRFDWQGKIVHIELAARQLPEAPRSEKNHEPKIISIYLDFWNKILIS